MKIFFSFLFVIAIIATFILLITSLVFRFKKSPKTKNFLKFAGIAFVLSIISFVGVDMNTTPQEKEALAKQRAEEQKVKKQKEQEEKAKKEEQEKLEEQKKDEEQKLKEQKEQEEKAKKEEQKKLEEQKKVEEQKLKEQKEQKEQEEKVKKEEQEKLEEQKKDEEQKLKEQKEQEEKAKKEEQKNNNDKIVYETEMKPQIDSMIKEYDDIWDQHWKPTWDNVNNNPNAINNRELQEQMEIISEKYDKISNKIVNFKYEDKLKDPTLKKHLSDFKNEFVLATGYRSNAAKAVTQGIKGLAPMEDRMQESLKSVKLSDEKLINAAAAMVTMEQKLDIKRS